MASRRHPRGTSGTNDWHLSRLLIC